MESTDRRLQVYGVGVAATISEIKIFATVCVLLSLPNTLLRTFLSLLLREGPGY